jgi:hypothetical protein
MAGPTDPTKQQGSLDFSGGVNSVVVPTIQSAQNPNGLKPNQLAWMVNAGVRDGGMTQRAGWKNKSASFNPQGIAPILLVTGLGLYQGSTFYEPDTGNPYQIYVIGGHVLQVDPDFSYPPIDLSAQFGLFLPSGNTQAYFVQAENYLVISAGDGITLPLFWNGTTLVQSNGITGVLVVGQPVPKRFQITTTAAWKEGAVLSQSTQLFLTVPYQSVGNLGDNLFITDIANNPIGHFRVTTVAPNYILLQSQTLPGAPSVIAAGTLLCAIENALVTAQNPAGSTATVALGAGSWVMPDVGAKVTIGLASGYFGEVGDIVNITSIGGVTNYGTFKVISFNATPQIVLQCVSLGAVPAGQTVTQTDLTVIIQSVRAFTSTWTTAGGWVVPPVGGSVDIRAVRFTPAYGGTIGDFVTIVIPSSGETVGLFRYTAPILPTGSQGAGSTFVCVATNNAGQTIGAGTGVTMRCTVSGPNGLLTPAGGTPYAQNILLGVGTWSVPAVGQNTGPATGQLPLNIYWNFPNQGVLNSYPGNVGDTITLVSNSPAYLVGTFKVVAFDGSGGITLQTISSSVIGTPLGTFTGPLIGAIGATATIPPSTTGTAINQLPAAYEMIYYMGRIWYNNGSTFSAGDIVGGPSGTSANNFLDSVLSVTENPIVLGGDGFTLPTQSGDITGFSEPNTIDASLGQGLLLIGTRKAIYAMQVPLTRNAWIAANSNNQPQIVEVQFRDGFVSQRSVVLVNGDVYYGTWEPAVRSLIQATRFFQEPGNVPLSAEENRILQFTDTSLLTFMSGINFNNYLYETVMPMQTPYGVAFQAIIVRDFTPISTASDKKPPVWIGHFEGVQVLQLLEQDFNGVDRAFAVCLSQNPETVGAIELWEITANDRFDNQGQQGEARVQWQCETPAYEWGDITKLKKLTAFELWIDRIFGTVQFKLDWRPDSQTCWNQWMIWEVCAARDGAELVPATPGNPSAYPVVCNESYRSTMTLSKPPEVANTTTGRPANQGFQMQFRLTVTGFCRIRGMWGYAEFMERKLYDQMVNTIKDFARKLKWW